MDISERTYLTWKGNLGHCSPEMYYYFENNPPSRYAECKYDPVKNEVYALGVLLIEFALCKVRDPRKHTKEN